MCPCRKAEVTLSQAGNHHPGAHIISPFRSSSCFSPAEVEFLDVGSGGCIYPNLVFGIVAWNSPKQYETRVEEQRRLT